MTESVVEMYILPYMMQDTHVHSEIWRETDLLKFPRVITEGGKDTFGK